MADPVPTFPLFTSNLALAFLFNAGQIGVARKNSQSDKKLRARNTIPKPYQIYRIRFVTPSELVPFLAVLSKEPNATA
jgi:hypothetical protein